MFLQYKNMYSNIPTQELVDLIIDIAMKNKIHSEVIRETGQQNKITLKWIPSSIINPRD
jgi:hypothetical protein